MATLIPVTNRDLGGETIQTVNARDLHAFLEVGKVFAAWIQERIKQYGFVEGKDFVVFSDSGNNPKGGRPSKEYAVSLDMAKELAMVERNEKGKQARQYFIECEKRAKAQPAIDPMQVLSDPAAMRGLLLAYTEKALTLETKVGELAPKAEAFNRIAGADGMLNLQTTGKVLQQPPNKFIQRLRELRWIFKRPGARYNSAHVDKINAGYLATKAHEYEKPDGTIHVNEQVMVTPKGLAKLALIFGVEIGGNNNGGIPA